MTGVSVPFTVMRRVQVAPAGRPPPISTSEATGVAVSTCAPEADTISKAVAKPLPARLTMTRRAPSASGFSRSTPRSSHVTAHPRSASPRRRPAPALSVSADVRYESARWEDDLNSRKLGAGVLLDARVAWRFAPNTEAYVAAENLTDETHREATSRIKDFAPGPGRLGPRRDLPRAAFGLRRHVDASVQHQAQRLGEHARLGGLRHVADGARVHGASHAFRIVARRDDHHARAG